MAPDFVSGAVIVFVGSMLLKSPPAPLLRIDKPPVPRINIHQHHFFYHVVFHEFTAEEHRAVGFFVFPFDVFDLGAVSGGGFEVEGLEISVGIVGRDYWGWEEFGVEGGEIHVGSFHYL